MNTLRQVYQKIPSVHLPNTLHVIGTDIYLGFDKDQNGEFFCFVNVNVHLPLAVIAAGHRHINYVGSCVSLFCCLSASLWREILARATLKNSWNSS